MRFINLINRTLDNTFYKNLISGFFKEVVDDIKILNNELYTNNPNQFVNYVYEEYELDPAIKNKIKEKYEKEYCPTSLFDYFNKSEKINYLILRNKIDKILNIKDVFYQI